jgi:hypothetical protein
LTIFSPTLNAQYSTHNKIASCFIFKEYFQKLSLILVIGEIEMSVPRLSVYLCLTSCLWGLETVSIKAETPAPPQPISNSQQIRSIARGITVKVMAGNLWGSGIIVKQEKGVYTILTNAHVARRAKTFKIQAPDGRVYQGRLLKSNDATEEDLAILTFTSPKQYRVARLVLSANSADRTSVFAAGFPAKSNRSSESGLVLTEGKITTLLPQSMKGGYQLGYTNDIYKGMSGGPLLNRLGEVIAVNGKHKFPLWGNTYIYQDGSTPDRASRQKMNYLSWGIPMQRVERKFPHLAYATSSNSTASAEVGKLPQTIAPQASESGFTESSELFSEQLPHERHNCQDRASDRFNAGENAPTIRPRKAW